MYFNYKSCRSLDKKSHSVSMDMCLSRFGKLEKKRRQSMLIARRLWTIRSASGSAAAAVRDRRNGRNPEPTKCRYRAKEKTDNGINYQQIVLLNNCLSKSKKCVALIDSLSKLN
jgi:hypothetical protein